MKRLLSIFLVLLLIGSASALPRTGGAQGIRVANLYVDGNVITSGTMTVGGVIVPQYWDFNVPISASSVDCNIFVPTSSWKVIAVSEVHTVGGSDSGAVTMQIMKCTGTQAPSAGSAVLNSTINLKGTANTIASGAVVVGSGLMKINATERLAIDFTGTMTALAGGVVTVRMQRI